MYRNEFYVTEEQKKTLEDVIAFLVENKKKDLVRPILDIMLISENWYGRLEELRTLNSSKIKED